MTEESSINTRHIIGVMTGTSIDGLDAALVAIEGVGLTMKATLLRQTAASIPAYLAGSLRDAAMQTPLSAGTFARIAHEFGAFHAEALAPLAKDTPIDLVVAHGQTVFHAPPISWQLLNPAPIVAALGCPVVYDLRQADLAAGGEGAPITPLADWILFHGKCDRAIVNLGGYCNTTLLQGNSGPAQVRGFDVCACNHVLDAVARTALKAAFDVDGAAATRGQTDAAAMSALQSLLDAQRSSGRSLGTGDEAIAWVEAHRERIAPDDLAASAAEVVGRTIGTALRDFGLAGDGEVLLAGGGARNRALASAIAISSACRTRSLDEIGVPVDAREAMEMAILGALASDGVPISLDFVTHRRAPVVRDGVWCFPATGHAPRTHDLYAALANDAPSSLP